NLKDPRLIEAILVSFRTTTVALIITILFGTPLAFVLAWGRFPIQRAVDTLVELPTVLPPAVAGVALLLAFGRRGLVGQYLDILGLQIAFTQVAVIMAQIFVAAPYYVRTVTLAFGRVDREQIQSAAMDGANSFQIARRMVIPLSWTALVTGSALMWARALGEFGATIIFAGNLPGVTQTMPLAIYLDFEVNMDAAVVLSVVLITISFLVLLFIKGFVHYRGLE
ncbi:MAG: ABC transporter permease, partial [Anaerolineales bacterium]|nr:ABC transporter permease [Anaerolineales bacterium]